MKKEIGKVAVVYAKNEGHYELLGGGVENDETPLQIFQREMLEVGYETTDLREVSIIREIWSGEGIETFSNLVLARAINEPREVTLTEKEIRRGVTLKWVSFEELTRLIAGEVPDTLMGRMKNGRDVVALGTPAKNKDVLAALSLGRSYLFKPKKRDLRSRFAIIGI